VVRACRACGRHATDQSTSLVAGHRFPRDIILLAVCYYLQLGAAAERSRAYTRVRLRPSSRAASATLAVCSSSVTYRAASPRRRLSAEWSPAPTTTACSDDRLKRRAQLPARNGRQDANVSSNPPSRAILGGSLIAGLTQPITGSQVRYMGPRMPGCGPMWLIRQWRCRSRRGTRSTS
jgi:hypothetical protein